MTSHRDESIMTGTRAMSGSEAIRRRKRTMHASESSSPSSMFTSMACAPFSTWLRATASAVSKSPSRTRRAKRGEPVTLVRSPTFTKRESGATFRGSRPASRVTGARSGGTRGATPATASTSARMWPGVVPQHPPTTLTRPRRAQSPTSRATSSGPRS